MSSLIFAFENEHFYLVKGPFTSFKLDIEQQKSEWMRLKFSPDGKLILLTSDGTSLLLVDSYTGAIVHTLTGCIFVNNLFLLKQLFFRAFFNVVVF